MSGKKKMQKAQELLDRLNLPYIVRYVDNRKSIPQGSEPLAIREDCIVYQYNDLLLMENSGKKIFILEHKKQ